MLTKDQAAEIFEKIKKLSTADEVEAMIYGGKFALTRFANNTIHQNVAEESYSVSVRAAFDGRTARATTNKFDDESLQRVVRASESLAKVQHPDPDLLPMPGAGESPAATSASPSRHFAETAALTPELCSQGVEKIVRLANQHKLTTAGIFSCSESVEGIFNSRGLSDWHAQTSSEISITMLAGDSSGWQKANSPDVSHLDPRRSRKSRRARQSSPRARVKFPQGFYTVILEPAAVLDMAGFMFWDFGGLSILDQRSFLNNRVGTPIFGSNINIWMTWPTPCSRARRSMARAFPAGGCNWWRMAWSNAWCMRAPRRKRWSSRNTKTTCGP